MSLSEVLRLCWGIEGHYAVSELIMAATNFPESSRMLCLGLFSTQVALSMGWAAFHELSYSSSQ